MDINSASSGSSAAVASLQNVTLLVYVIMMRKSRSAAGFLLIRLVRDSSDYLLKTGSHAALVL